MTIMDVIKKMGKNKGESGKRFKEMQEQDRLDTMLEERKKSANQRELEKHFKDKREEDIKERLDVIRKKRNKDTWKGNSILKGGPSILHTDKSALSSGKSMMREKNIFLGHGSIMSVNKHEGFFKL